MINSNIRKFQHYGKLSKIVVEQMQTGKRIKGDEYDKENIQDFALWKFWDEKDGDIFWETEIGKGRPGWHIECSAMSMKWLGEQIDIHTGGIDLIFPHHENEIAQSEACTGKEFVKYWLHNEHITIEGKKISKSLGNTVYLRQIVDRGYSPRALRYWVLTGHYRTPMNFTWEAIGGADQTLKRLTRHFLEAPSEHTSSSFLAEFYSSIGNDLKTAQGLALVWKHIKTLDKKTLREVDRVLGLGFSDPQASAKLSVLTDNELPAEVQKLVAYLKSKNAPVEYTEEVTNLPVTSWKKGGVGGTTGADGICLR